MKRLFAVAVAFAVACTPAFADSSYLLIQGPFGPSDSTTYSKWRIDYEAGSLITGGDLLSAIFGTPQDTGTTKYGAKLFAAGDATKGISFLEYEWGLMVYTISLNGTEVFAGPDMGDPFWGYFVAGGSGNVDPDFNPTGFYPNEGSWSFSNDGFTTRILEDGSFDAWTFWGDAPGGLPLEAYFGDAMVVPEPGSIALVFLGLSGIWVFKRRKCQDRR